MPTTRASAPIGNAPLVAALHGPRGGHGRHQAFEDPAVIGGLSFLAFDLWWLALSYLAFPRIIFAWGMDRMGPKWFTDVNPR